MTHSRSDLVAWHRRCSADYRARALRDEHGHCEMLYEVAARHAATARLLERDGKRRRAKRGSQR
jgi:hypothetical protein